MARIPTLYTTLWSSADVINVKQYGALGDGVNDDAASINSAITAARATGGPYRVFFPPGNYRITAPIDVHPLISLEGVPSQSVIQLDNGSGNCVTINTASQQFAYIRIKDLCFEGLQDNNSNVIDMESNQNWVLIENCALNPRNSGPYHLNGTFIWLSAPGQLLVKDCHIRSNSTFNEAIRINNASARVQISNNLFIMPASTTQAMVGVINGFATINDNFFDMSAHSSGTGAAGIGAFDTTHATSINDNVFYANGGPTHYAVTSASGAYVVGHGNTIYGSITPLNPTFLAPGSYFDQVEASYGSFGSSTSGTVATNVRAYSMSFSGTAPTITMPTKLWPGQELIVSVRNVGPGSWAGVGAVGLDGPLLSATIGGSQAITFHAKVLSLRANGTWVWAMTGQYSINFTTS